MRFNRVQLLAFTCGVLLIGNEVYAQAPPTTDPPSLTFEVELTTARQGFDGETCWVHARAGAIPPGVPGNSSENPFVVMTTQKLLLSGSDLFLGLNELTSDNLGETWTGPEPLPTFERQSFSRGLPPPTGAEIAADLLRRGDVTTVCDFTPKWHAASGKLLGIGHTAWYRDDKVIPVRPRATAYAVYDPATRSWSPWRVLEMPDEPRFQNAGAGSVQRVDLPDGDILLPVYFKEPEAGQYSTAVLRCQFDGETLSYVEHGDELSVDVKRGLYEPSLTKFQDRFYLTMRNDDHGYVAVSEDGMRFSKPRKWTFDDGSDLGNYNTQQHWVTHSDGLFLVYTRRGAENDHVFRHRAPLFIAHVSPNQPHVLRHTEQILVPQRGARLGNFGVVDVSPQESWVTVTEWMQPKGVEKCGSDNSLFVARIKWNRPNRLTN